MPNPQPDLLKGLTVEEVSAVMALGQKLNLASGTVLFQLGAEADRIYLIERGRIRLTLPMQVEGHEEDILVEERLPGETVGWSALIPPHRFTLKATAQMDAAVVALPQTTLMKIFSERPNVAYAVTRNVAAIIGQRLQVFQAMWLREVQRVVELRRA
ncbi:MAG: cyclic nucleotide-binding domain-containing protein [Acidobacteriota bacterium]